MRFPKGKKFKVIMADPPWPYQTWGNGAQVPARGEQPYETMSLDELQKLPVSEAAADDCVLVMWVISSHVAKAIMLGICWGFEFKTLGFVWEKTQKGDPTKLKMGMGKWLRQECEISLLFTRGKPKRVSAGVRQVIQEPAREHSRKPDVAYERLEELCAGPYLELFSRTDRKGWTAWGDQTGHFNTARALPNKGRARSAADLLG